jgi:hypothetical protein
VTDYISRCTGQGFRFSTALSVTIPFFLIDSLPVKGTLFLLLYLFLPISGKKIRIFNGLILFGAVLFFQLLSPRGAILWERGPFLITDGALEEGLLRGMTLLGLVNLSLISIRPGLVLPGKGGALLARTLFYFGQFMDMGDRIKEAGRGKGLAVEMDLILEEIYSSGHGVEENLEKDRRGLGYFMLVSLIFWGGLLWEKMMGGGL